MSHDYDTRLSRHANALIPPHTTNNITTKNKHSNALYMLKNDNIRKKDYLCNLFLSS